MGNRILAVDDEPDVLRLVKLSLERAGHTVETACDGQEALRRASAGQYDLIISDVMMPKMNGVELTKALKADPKLCAVPVILLTAVGEFESQLRRLEDDIEDYLTKPFSPAELVGLVGDVLDESQREFRQTAKMRKRSKLRTMVNIMQRKREES